MSFPPYLLSRMIDLQESPPRIRLKLTKVGVKNLIVQLKVKSKHGAVTLLPTIELYVDLPSSRRGVHLSRDPESLYEILNEYTDSDIYLLEDFCEALVRGLLSKHEYASRAEVNLQSKYIVPRSAPGQSVVTQEPYDLFAMATASRTEAGKINITRAVGVKVSGFTACPCTQSLLKALASHRLAKIGYDEEDIGTIFENVTCATHTQRTTGYVLLTVPEDHYINVEDLTAIVEQSMSGQTYAILKRPAEASVVEKAARQPMFTEDVVREVLLALSRKYEALPDNVGVFVQMVSNESVHKHDVIAERTTTLGEIRQEIKLTDLQES